MKCTPVTPVREGGREGQGGGSEIISSGMETGVLLFPAHCKDNQIFPYKI